MQVLDSPGCPNCGAGYEDADPFCLECGELLPSVVFPGDLSVEMSEVPSDKLRGRIVGLLKSWFPRIDSVEADERLKKKSVIVKGVDEESGRRLIKALEKMKVGAGLTKGPGLFSLLFNGGLVITALALVLMVVLLPFGFLGTKLLLFLVMVAAPLIGAYRKREQMKPLAWTPTAVTKSEQWPPLARAYADMKGRMNQDEWPALKEIFRGVFELFGRLSRGSLPALAAGKERGELASRLEETMETALEIARRRLSAEGDQAQTLRQELQALRELVTKTTEWFRSIEGDKVRATPAIEADIREIKESIDRIVGEVRATEQTPIRRREETME